jgi:hypothetical protein
MKKQTLSLQIRAKLLQLGQAELSLSVTFQAVSHME